MKPRFSTLLSVVVHTVIVGTVVIWSAVAPGALPSPHDIIGFADITPVKLPDVPPPPRRATHDRNPTDPSVAPIVPPDRIVDQHGAENVEHSSGVGDVSGVDYGLPGGLEGGIEVVVPPPPQRREEPPPTTTPIRLHAGIEAPHKIVDASPEYPAAARATRQEGIVILESVIDSDGKVESVRVLKGLPLLNQSAIDAVRQWRFTPARLNGHPVPVVMTVTVMFRLQ